MRYKQIKPLLEQTLMEINMSPTSLRQLASKINARAGMEFEMIVPNVKIDGSDDFESEPDYDYDEPTGSIRNIRGFFHDGDHNSRRDVDNLVEELEQEFYEWRQERMDEEWASDGREFFEQWVRNNVSDDEWITGEDDEDEDESFSNFVDREWEAQDRHYTDAYNEFVEDHEGDYDDGDWLNAVDYNYMSNIAGSFDINWPYWTEYQGDDDGMAVENIADDFSGAIGRPVNHSTDYHGASREEGTYVVEPDGSLKGADNDDGGLEFVSPPLPIAELLSDLQKVKRWAKRRGCYTGADYGTGLHINVSVDGWAGIENLDYVKLAILLGDEYVLQQFQRQSNNYCKSALGLVKDAIKKNPLTAKELLEKMKTHMNTAASKLIHTGTTNKFTSINTKDGYVEFRSPGGDWLNEFEDKIEPTLLRFVVALDAAVHEDKYKQEYQKKLYKLLAPSGDKSTIEYFAKYVAGDLPKAALKSFVRQAQRERSPKGSELQSYNVKDVSGYVMMFQARNPNQAMQMAREQYPSRFRDIVDVSLHSVAATQQPAAQPAQTQGNWGIWIQGQDRFLRMHNTLLTDNILRRFPSREAAEQWIEQCRAENPHMRTDIEVREIEPTQPARPAPAAPVPGSTADIQQRRAQGEFTGAWRVVDSQGNEIYRFSGVGNSQSDANRVAIQWLRDHPEHMQSGAEVLPIMGDA